MAVENNQMKEKICLVTGATRGLGQAAARGLARMGATVIIVGRNQARIDQTTEQIRGETGNPCVEGLLADLSSQTEVRRVAGDFLSRHSRLDVLVNNVGGTFLNYQPSPDGYEMTWALNYLNHFLLTRLLLGASKAAAKANGEARIIEMTSSVYRWSNPRFDRLPQGGWVQGVLAYAKSKRALIVFAGELSRRLNGAGVTINTVTPGWVRSNIASSHGFPFSLIMRTMDRISLTPETGVKPVLHLATAPELRGTSGKYFYQFKQMPDDPTCHDRQEATRLWQISEKMTCLEGVYEP